MADTLTDKVKRKLDITWDDAGTNSRIEDIMNNAKTTLVFKLGVADSSVFEQPGQEQQLFLAYCFYEWNHAVDDFDNNYRNEILQVRMKAEVSADAEG